MNRLTRRIFFVVLSIVITLAVGTVGFAVIDHYPVFDAFYATQVEYIVDNVTAQTMNRDAGAALLDRIGPAIVVTHSQSGPFGWLIGDARPDKVKAIVALEPSGPPFQEAVFSTDKARAKNRDVLNAEIDKRVATYGSAELVEKLNKAGVPAGPIYKMDEMFADPQVKHLQMAHPVHSPKLGDIELIGQAINMSRTPFEMRSATPEQGEHTEAVLKEAGYDAAAIASFRQRGVI